MSNSNNDVITIDLKKNMIEMFRIVKKYKILLAVFILLGVLFGIFRYFEGKEFYEAKMVIKANDFITEAKIDEATLFTIVKPIEESVNNENVLFVKNNLKVNSLQSIKNIKVVRNKEDGIIEIVAKVYMPEVLDTIQRGILEYCNSNALVMEIRENNKKLSNKILEAIDRRINMFDSLIFSEQYADFQAFIAVSDYPSIVNIELEKIRVQQNLQQKNIVLLEGFSEYPMIGNNRRNKAIISFFVFLALGIFSVIFIEIYNKIKDEVS